MTTATKKKPAKAKLVQYTYCYADRTICHTTSRRGVRVLRALERRSACHPAAQAVARIMRTGTLDDVAKHFARYRRDDARWLLTDMGIRPCGNLWSGERTCECGGLRPDQFTGKLLRRLLRQAEARRGS